MTLRILDKLYASDTNLTKADLALLEYVKAKGLDACNAPISEIAKSCGVSHATVTRSSLALTHSKPSKSP